MLDFSSFLNLPYLWGGILAAAILLYVLLDGFDLGVGILFPFAPSDACRNKMMLSIAPFWDGNETWLVLGGGGLFAAFPRIYSILMPAFYIPIILMLLGLIFRGIAFEFRFKAKGVSQKIWDYSFHFGSLLAAFFQGVMLGAFIHGVEVRNGVFAGSSFDWLTPFSLMTGVALLFGYSLIGASWIILKTHGITQQWAYRSAKYVLVYVMLFIGIVSLWAPFENAQIFERWFTMPNFAYFSVIPLLTVITLIALFRSLVRQREWPPFLLTIALFLLCYVGLAVSLWPWAVPYQITLTDGAAAATSLSLTLLGAALSLPCILVYTAYSYYVFRGKSTNQPPY